ncbi:carbonic anhydrase 14 isoform X3 [Falco naumanni]|uniref:carbonic anhydrase 14 isoform X3 n=1 Tax=Falco naumanni TaxID=148594 RepID=UPI001ADE80C4|nr:carbonic anhydrase 14 isoform X3 [Falco naumanni]
MLRALLLLGGLAPTLPAGPHWAYEGPHGQQHWPQGHPACGGRAQSPIDIQRRGAQPDPSLPPLGYQHPTAPAFALANNGHTAVLVLPPTLRLRGLPRPFAAAQLHFHWGRPGRAGAEHLLDGHRAPAEMHVVHYDAERYANASEAQHHAGGLAVLGVLLEVGADPHPAYDNILSHLGSIRYAACRTCCPPAWTSTTATTGPSPPPRASRGSSGPSSSSPSASAWRRFWGETPAFWLEQLQGTLYATGAAEPEPQRLVDNFRIPQELNERLVLSSFPREPEGYSTGEVIAIVFGAVCSCLGVFLAIHFVAKRIRARGTQEQDVVFKASSRRTPDDDPHP